VEALGPSMFTFLANSERDTERLGAALASVLPAGTVVGLIGPLGAGKTRLVQAVAAALGVRPGSVTSPTFVLVNEYTSGRLPVYHFDTYRLKDDDDFLNLGPEEYFDSAGVTFVEWADRVATLLPPDHLEITIEPISETERRISLLGTSPNMESLVDRIRIASELTT
jgi:tRNA threonylcarbamoyladenosine biosynthesis protein TsaE